MSWRARSSSGFEAFRSELERQWRSAADLVVLPAVDSTNTFARQRLDRAGHGASPQVVVAWEQTSGRGRRGRVWQSPPGGGLYASVTLPVTTPQELDALPLAVPVELCRALELLGVTGCGLKWPNDLLIGERKLGGLLVEAVSRAGSPSAAVIGIGINYREPDPANLGARAIALTELLQPLPSLAAVTLRLLEPLAERLAAPRDLSELMAAYRKLTVHRAGDRLSCRTASETVEGEFAGFDEHGHLRLRAAAGERRIAAGEIVEL